MSAAVQNRMPLIDALKGVAAQIIIFHHLASYGPLADAFEQVMPLAHEFLFDYGRMVVQLFLVVGGFLVVHGFLSNDPIRIGNPVLLLWRRYQRLAPPFIVAMLIAVVISALARLWLDDEAVPGVPTIRQFIAHALLLHGVLDMDSLSAGVWYVAIDLQLYFLLTSLVWLAYRICGQAVGTWIAFCFVLALALAALFYFNRDADWDDWGMYYFGSYALGGFSAWLATRKRIVPWLVALGVIVGLALFVDFRIRIAIALSVSMILTLGIKTGGIKRWFSGDLFAWFGRISYSVFLVHFPICLLANALFDRFSDGGDHLGMAAIIAAWLFSLASGDLFYRYVETRRRWVPSSVTVALRKVVAVFIGRAA